MGKWLIIGGAVFLFGIITIATVFGIGVSTYNSVVGIENLVKVKQEDNKNEYDNMWKKISQVAQVTEKDRSSLMDIFVKHAEARTGDGAGTPVMNWIKESVPNISSANFTNLQNVITSSRDRWTMRQKELLDFKRQHDDYRTKFPSSIICGMFGIKELKVIIVTSGKTDNAFETGKDDDVKVF